MAKDYRLSKAEQETVITFNAEDGMANVYSATPAWVTKIKKIDGWKVCGAGVEVDVPKAWIKMSPPRKVNFSEETKAKMIKRLAEAKKKRRI